MSNVRYYYCPECFRRYTSLISDGDLCDFCTQPLENEWEE